MKKIYIKFYFGKWKEVSKNKALDFITKVKNGIVALKETEKNEFINKRFLKNITVEELETRI